MQGVRVDKWLWAGRFFKTRSLAKQQIDGGRVHVNGQKCKASKELCVGDEVSLWQGWSRITVRVQRLSDQRRGAPEAQTLYRETPESIQKRTELEAQRKAERAGVQMDPSRPSKRQRRQIHRFKRVILDSGQE